MPPAQLLAWLDVPGVRVVAVDPGIDPMFTVVVHNETAIPALVAERDRGPRREIPADQRHEVVRWTAARWYQESGATYRIRRMATWRRRSPGIRAIEAGASQLTAKTGSLQAYVRHIGFERRRQIDNNNKKACTWMS